MNLVKKFSVFALMIATVVSMSGGLTVKAAGNYNAGSLLAKAGVSGAAVYYIGSDGMKYVFPDVKTYNTWYENFDNVVKVSVAELDMYPDGGAVTYREGSYLVTHADTSKVYALEPGGTLRWIPTAETAAALYGANWGSKVMDVIPGFFSSSYTMGSDLGSTLPTGTIAMEQGGTTYYRIDGTTKRPFASMDAFEANNFNLDFVVTADLSAYTSGTSITGQETALSGFMPGEGTVVPVNGNLTVSLSSQTPAAGNVVINVDNVVFGKFNFAASSAADAVVNAVEISRTGLGATGNFTSVTLYDGSTKLGSTRTSWSSDGTINYNISGGWIIPAGTTKTLTMVAKLGTAGTYNALGVSDVTLGSGSVSGSLPVFGNQMTGVNVAVGGVTITDAGTAATKKIGETDVTLAQFELENTGSVEDSEFISITLKNKGNASDDDVANLKLYQGATQLAGAVQMINDKITFVLDDPYAIDKGDSETFKVVGDITNGDTHTVEFILDTTTDLNVQGLTYNTALTVTSSAYDAATEGSIITIDGAELNIAFTSETLETIDDQNNIVFGELVLSSGSANVKVTEMIFTIDETDGNSDATDNKDVDEFELVEEGGSAYVGTMTNGGDGDADDETWTFSDEIYLMAGEARTFALRGDFPAGIGDGDSYKVTMTVNTTNLSAETDPEGDIVDNFSVGSLTGKLVTVQTPYLTITADAMNTGDAVINEQGAEIFKGTIEATAGPITISRMRFEGANTAAGNVTVVATNMDADNWTGIGLYFDEDSQQLLTSSSLTDGELDFNSFSYTLQPGSANKINFTVMGDVEGTLSANTTVHVQLDTVTAKDADNDAVLSKNSAGTTIVTTAELETTRTLTLTDKGILYTSLRNADTGYNKDRVLLAGDSAWVAKLRLRAQYETIQIEDLKLTNTSSDDEDSIDSVCIYTAESATEENLVGCSTMDTNDVVAFNDINEDVAVGTTDWYVYATTRNMGNGATATADTKDQIALKLATTTGHLVAKGLDSNESLTYGNSNGTVAAGEMVFDANNDGTFDAVADGVIGGTATSKDFIVAGSKITNVSLVDEAGGEAVDTLISGTGTYTLAILKVDTAANSNADANGDDLLLAINNFVLDVTKFNTTTFSGATIDRIGGTTAAQALTITGADEIGETDGDWTMVNVTSTLGADSMVEPGETAYFVVKGTIDGLDATTGVVDWVRVSLDALNSGTNNIDWFDGYDTTYATASDFDYLRIDTDSITGTKVAESL